MSTSQVQGDSSTTTSAGRDVEPGAGQHNYLHGEGKLVPNTVTGQPIDKSKTGRARAAKYVYALNFSELTLYFSIAVNLQLYVINSLHQDISTASTITTNFAGTGYILAVLGGFVSDTFLGHYASVIVGSIIQIVGLGVLLFSATYSGLQPPACSPTAPCPPAGAKYMGALYAAIYTIALGSGFIQAALGPFGADQFDNGDDKEVEESIHFFTYLYFTRIMGDLMGFTLTVYLLNYQSKAWGFGYMLPLVAVCLAIFLIGTPKYRRFKAGGSFLTRIAQVTIAALRKRNLAVPEDVSQLHDEPVAGSWLKKSNKLRFLDKASVIEENRPTTSKWRLAGVTQVEETKRIYALLPVWLPTCFLSVSFSEVVTFTATQGKTLDRKLATHFEVPPQSLGVGFTLIGLIIVPIYDKLIMPVMRKHTGNPYGISPLKRIGFACLLASLSLAAAALVEQKRLTYIRSLGYTHTETFDLPMTMWWLLPQYFCLGLAEFCLVIPLYEFYYHEVSEATRSISVSLLFAAFAIGYYFSSVMVNVVNRITKHRPGGRWLKERLNDGGLERYFWLLAIIGFVNFLLFLCTSHFYQYNYRMFRIQRKKSERPSESEPHFRADTEVEPESKSSKFRSA